MKTYRRRVVDSILSRKLKGKGAVLIEGPKWCGKTTTAEQVAASILYMDHPKSLKQNLMLADISPETLLEGEKPRLIDEWQLAPKLWDTIRFSVDHADDLGQYILTGSATPADRSQIHHSGTGRFAWLKMRPMSLVESGESSGKVHLGDLLDGVEFGCQRNALSLHDVAYLTCRGGWPKALDMDREIALEQANDYYDAVIHNDLCALDGVHRNSERVKRVLRSYARNIGSQSSITAIARDVCENESADISSQSLSSYLEALRQTFVIEDMPAWNPNLRSRTAIRSSDTRYFIDPSIAAAALGIGPDDLIADLNTFGLMFENLCIRDLRVFADALDGDVYHYRDKEDLECDAVVHLRSGKYGLIEIKLGGDAAIEHGVMTLQKLRNKIDCEKMSNPSFLMVLTAVGDYAYRRSDGICVVPIGCLGV